MRAWSRSIVGVTFILAASPVWAQGRYDPAYPVCMEAYGSDGSYMQCFYTSMEQCRQGTIGTGGTCFNNPTYVPPPPEPEVAAVAPAVPPPVKKPKPKAVKSAKSQGAAPAQPPAPMQTH